MNGITGGNTANGTTSGAGDNSGMNSGTTSGTTNGTTGAANGNGSTTGTVSGTTNGATNATTTAPGNPNTGVPFNMAAAGVAATATAASPRRGWNHADHPQGRLKLGKLSNKQCVFLKGIRIVLFY